MTKANELIAYVRLMDERTEVWRPTRLRAVSPGVYEMLEDAPYGERWEFEKPAQVRCETRTIIGGQRLAVIALAE